MIPIHIEFQEGWEGTRVLVRVDDALPAELEPRTRMQTGFAAALVVEVDPGPHVIAVELVDAAVSAEHALDVVAETWLGVSRSAPDAVSFREQPTLFGYV
ncbi:hypothetical protein [Microbacterium sulfonylureivorans]|uniref:hypothetical protein n=1 Tax=Microbacterium sulfonylureivorans TaxID=2486854 RepID=UPI000FD76D05|nr:hypothetical protein [Microbacterium sulfonylureivorans]